MSVAGCNPLIIHSGESKIVNKNGFLFITIDEGEYNDGNYLVNYVADNDSTSEEPTQITLPEDFDGESYIINSYAFAFCGFEYGYFGDMLVIPEKVTSIRNCAFDRQRDF